MAELRTMPGNLLVNKSGGRSPIGPSPHTTERSISDISRFESSSVNPDDFRARVVVFNVKYSENLGDGLIAETLEAGLRSQGHHVVTRDLAGRGSFGSGAINNRRLLLKLLRHLPPIIRRQAVALHLNRKLAALAPGWRQDIAEADHVVVGGGHLFQDGDLNFPLKVGAVLKLARELGKPVSIHAVGVTERWSTWGRRLFGRLLECETGQVTVRDSQSQRFWQTHFAGTHLEDVDVAPDPVIALTAERGAGQYIALGVTSGQLLSYHGGQSAGVGTLYRDVASSLLAQGHRVCVFSNGAQEDEQQIDVLLSDAALQTHLADGTLVRVPRAKTPQDLIAVVAGASVMVGHRLHASILAYALGVPAVGLGWDPKLRSFYARADRLRFFVEPGQLGAEDVAALALEAMEMPFDPDHRSALRAEADGAMADLAAGIGAKLRGRGASA